MMYVMTHFDYRMEGYCRLASLLLWTFVALDDREPGDKWTPLAAWVVYRPFEQVILEKAPAGYAGVLVQTSNIHQDDDEAFDIIGDVMHSPAIYFEQSAQGQGDWQEGENPMTVIRTSIGEYAWPTNRNLMPWGNEPVGVDGCGWMLGEQPADMWSAYRYSDRALESLVFDGIGQHRIVKINRTHPGPAGTDAPPGAYYAVVLGFATILEQKPGFDDLGADAYFDRNGHILAIVRKGVTFTPDGELGTGRSCSWHFGLLGWRYKCSAWRDGWLHAKLAFRGTLFAVVTLVDHLLSMHLTYGNALSITSKEELPPKHPLRQLMQALTYRTDAVNYAAKVMLLDEKAYIRRATALTEQGMHDVFAFGNSTLHWTPMLERSAGRSVDSIVLPMNEDGEDLYGVLHDYVIRFLDEILVQNPYTNGSATEHLPSSAGDDVCARDPHVVGWYRSLSRRLPSGLPSEITCASLGKVIATFAYDVTAGHRHVGSVASETEDPCFAPWAWRPGELCGTPRQTYALASLMSLTSQNQPRLADDFTFLFDSEATKQLWRDLKYELDLLGKRVNTRNDAREAAGRRRYRVVETDSLEVSVAI